MTHQHPWRIEYLNAEGTWILTHHNFRTKRHAQVRLPTIERDQPGVEFRIRRHVDFEART